MMSFWKRSLAVGILSQMPMTLYGLAPSVALQSPATAQAESQPQKQAQPQSRTVTLTLENVQIGEALQAIVREAGATLVVDGNDARLKTKLAARVRIRFSAEPIEKAIAAVLKETGYEGIFSKDGRMLMVTEVQTRSVTNDTSKVGIIAGRVTDSASGSGLSGVSISIRNTKLSATSTGSGEFTFVRVPQGKHTIDFKLLGYRTVTREVEVVSGKTSNLRAILNPTATMLSDVVTTATGSQRRVEVAHDIAKINVETIMERTPVRSVADVLEAAQVPGVLVQRGSGDPGAPTRIRIRGIGSISQTNDPVVILDGVWIDASASKPSRLDDIDPSSIASIEVIRGPSAATLFGQDASNGVIVITTKKGKAGPIRWNLSYNRDWGQTYGRQPIVYAGMGTRPGESERMACRISDVLRYDCIQDTVIAFDLNNELFSREGVETNNRYVVQVDGGTQNLTYSLSASTSNTIGVRRGAAIDGIRYRILGYTPTNKFNRPSDLNRTSLTSNVTIAPRSDLNMSVTLTGSQSALKDNSIAHSWGLPYYGSAVGAGLDTIFPNAWRVSTMRAKEQPVRTTSGILATTVQYRPFGAYVINGNVGVEKADKNESMFQRETHCTIRDGCSDSVGRGSEQFEHRSVYTVRFNASTNLNLGGLSKFLELRPSIGGDYRKTDQRAVGITMKAIPVGENSISAGVFESSNRVVLENATAGWYLNSMVGVFRRIYFDVGIRQDIGSAITSSKNAAYPKIGGSWLVSEESFWKKNRFINNFRLRSAIGHAAIQPDLEDIHGQFSNNMEYIDGKFVRSVNLTGIGNRVLRPERAVEIELGFDLDMLDDRLNFIATYAHTENKNTLVSRKLPASLGTTSPRKENIARVQNRNFELSANARAMETQHVLLILNYALTLSDNVVKKLGNGIGPFTTQQNRIEAGYPVGAHWSYVALGYWDADNNGLLSLDEVIFSDSTNYIGWSQPRYRASYGVTFTVNNQFTFDSRFAYQSRYVQAFGLENGYGTEDANAPLNAQANALVSGGAGKKPISDMRWSSASVTYHLPKSMLSRIGARAASVSLQGNNLGLWTNYAGRDPGINGDILTSEVPYDYGTTPPRPRLFVLDFKVGF